MAKAFGIATDPLGLNNGTDYVASKVSTRVGGEWVEIPKADGGFMQRNSKTDETTVRCDYYLSATATAPDRGATLNGYVVDETDLQEASKQHRTLSVTATSRTNVDLEDVA
jgi:hypothetical protein